MGVATRPEADLRPPTEPRRHRHPTPTPWFRPTWSARLRRTVLALLVATAVIAPVSAAARPQIPAPRPASLAPLTPTTLQSTYEANRANAAQAARMAEAHGDRSRAATDRWMAAPARQLLTFDGRGPGQAVEVLGDLLKADHIAVLVPGSDTSLDTYDRFHKAALALHDRTGPDTAVIAWLGYETPGTISTTVLTPTRAEQAAPHLRTFTRELRGLSGDSTSIALLCHSYGSVVCAHAATDLKNVVDDIALIGSPGTGVDSVAALHTSARVWAARGADDWIATVPHTRTDLFGTTLGFGPDPTSPSYGAHVFPAGPAGHSDYFTPNSIALENLAGIAQGARSEVPHA
ncbi:alpha/beta hydrolase family protein [Streptomyces sp. DSM 40750]|uniref:alpha/beta hydrolase family protein n=1 Tax=Streptomyces sp. DSM 40750 TaxID=2801030 RepID=UPI00214C5661|nr:alpha/beta hydrolase family protein [Streptomyces sp. DSM 40750]UUU23882.1 alpha/beta hydrolase family protein [Streptomyces sp. DSM 40750]